MKRVIKILIFVLFVSASLNVKAKTFVEEIVRSYTDYTNISDNYIVLTDHDTFITTGSKGYFDGYKNNRHNNQFMEFTFDGELLKSNFFKTDGTYNTGVFSGDGYILVGYHQNYNKFQAETDRLLQITKLDEDGNVIWNNIYDENRNGTFYNIIKTKDNNYLAIGKIRSTDNSKDKSIIVKYKSNGDIIWSKEHDLNFSNRSTAKETENGSFLIETYTTDDQYSYYAISLFNSSGEYIKDLDIDFGHNALTEVFYVNDNSIYASINDDINHNASIMKFDINGNIIKEKNLGDVRAESFSVTNDNYLIVSYYSESYYIDDESFNSIGYATKLDSNLNTIWDNQINEYNGFNSKTYLLNNNRALSLIGWEDMLLFTIIDINGNLIQIKELYSNKNAYVTSDVYINADGSFYLAGDFNYLTYFDKNLKKAWEKNSNYQSYDGNKYYRLVKNTNDQLIVYNYNENKLVFNIYSSDCKLLDTKEYDDIHISDFIPLKTGGFIGIGLDSSENVYFSKFNNLLEKQNSKSISITDLENITNLIQGVLITHDNKVLIEGEYYVNDSYPLITICYNLVLNLDGNVISLTEIDENTEIPFYENTVETSSHEYITASGGIQPFQENNSYIKKYSSDFNLLWKKEYIPDVENTPYFSDYPGISLNNFYFGKTIKLDDNNYAITGDGAINDPNSPSFYFKVILIVDMDGNIKYEKFFGAPNGDGISGLEISDARKLDDDTFRFVLSNHIWEGGTSYPVIFDLYYRYDLTKKTSQNGTFTIDKIIAKNKEIITVNIKPKFGYIFDKIILTDTKGNKTEIHDLTFEMIPDDVEVEVVFRELINPKTGYSLTTTLTMIGVLLYFTLRKKREA